MRDRTEDLLRTDLEELMDSWADAPIADVEATLQRIRTVQSQSECDWLNKWINKQRVCSIIIKYHGQDTLERVMREIAVTSKRLKGWMSPRVESFAVMMGI